MSAYAMPGLFSLSLPTAAGAVPARIKKEGGSSSICTTPAADNNRTSFANNASGGDNNTGSEHERVSTIKTPAEMTTESESSASVAPANSGSLCASKSKSPRRGDRMSEVSISVKSAKIDPIKLVRAVSRTAPGNGTKTRSHDHETSGSDEFHERKENHNFEDNVEPMTASSEASRAPLLGIRPRDDGDSDSEYSSTSDDESENSVTTSLHVSPISPDTCSTINDDAIEFELSISFNGRKYTATRALPSFVQLRNDLVNELECSGNEAQGRVGSRTRRQMRHQKKLSDLAPSHDGRPNSDINEQSLYSIVSIPELPIGYEELSKGSKERNEIRWASAGAYFGRGFTTLQALMRSYCPAMERWLRHVADIIPPNTSPGLTKFLWEPLTSLGIGDAGGSGNGVGKNTKKKYGSGVRLSNSRLWTLPTIVENSHDADELEEEVLA